MASVDESIINDHSIEEDEELALRRILDANNESCGLDMSADLDETHQEDDHGTTVHDENNKPEVSDSNQSITNNLSELEDVDVNVKIGSFTPGNQQIKNPEDSVNSKTPQPVTNSINTPKVTSALHKLREMVDPGNEGKPGIATVFDFDLTTLEKEDKPWMQPEAKLSDYFNYSFDEESWSHYCNEKRAVKIQQQEVKPSSPAPTIPTNVPHNPAPNSVPVGNPIPVIQSRTCIPVQVNQMPETNHNVQVPNVTDLNVLHTQDMNETQQLETSLEEKNCESSYSKSSHRSEERDNSSKKNKSHKRPGSPNQVEVESKKLRSDQRYDEAKNKKHYGNDYKEKSKHKHHYDKDYYKEKSKDKKSYHRERDYSDDRESRYDDMSQNLRSRNEFDGSRRDDLRQELIDNYSYNHKRNISRNEDHDRKNGKERKYRK